MKPALDSDSPPELSYFGRHSGLARMWTLTLNVHIRSEFQMPETERHRVWMIAHRFTTELEPGAEPHSFLAGLSSTRPQ